MGLYELLDHRCDIYHIIENSDSPGFSLPSSPSFVYSETPDESDILCHFEIRLYDNVNLKQREPQNEMQVKIKLTLPLEADIRFNDKIVNRETGLEYTAEMPRTIRQHHKFVYIRRSREQRPL